MITYGQTLADSVLSGNASTVGIFEWKDSEIIPNVSDSNNTDYIVVFIPDDTTNYNTVDNISAKLTVNKAIPEITTPTAKILTYNGTAQELVNPGSVTGGTILYAVTDDNKTPDESIYSASIPKEIKSGVYYVWYKVKGNDNHEDISPACLTAEIDSAQVTYYDETRENGENATKYTKVFKSGNIIILSADVSITSEKTNFEIPAGLEFSTAISIDVNLEISDNAYKNYVYSLDIANLPGWLEISGETENTDNMIKNSYHHEITLSGKPSKSQNIIINALINIFGENSSVLDISVSKDINIFVHKPVLKSLDIKIKEDSLLRLGTDNLSAIITGFYSDGTSEIITDNIKITWQLNGQNLYGIDIDENGTFHADENVAGGVYNIPVSVTAKYKELTASAAKIITVTVKNPTPSPSADIEINADDISILIEDDEKFTEIFKDKNDIILTGGFSGTNISGIIQKIGEVTEIKTLAVSGSIGGSPALIINDCAALTSLDCSSCGISELKIENCPALKYLDCSYNSLKYLDASELNLNSLKCGGQTVKNLKKLTSFNLSEFLPESGSGIFASYSYKSITGLKAFDETGRRINAEIDSGGNVSFSEAPSKITYYYDTGFDSILMDVTVETVAEEEKEEESRRYGSGGCNSVRSVLLFIAIFNYLPGKNSGN